MLRKSFTLKEGIETKKKQWARGTEKMGIPRRRDWEQKTKKWESLGLLKNINAPVLIN